MLVMGFTIALTIEVPSTFWKGTWDKRAPWGYLARSAWRHGRAAVPACHRSTLGSAERFLNVIDRNELDREAKNAMEERTEVPTESQPKESLRLLPPPPVELAE